MDPAHRSMDLFHGIFFRKIILKNPKIPRPPNILVLFVVLFYLFFVLLVFGSYYLDVVIYDNLQDLEEEDFEQQLARNPRKHP
jgi:hypothetical protein